jgi:hypothetical protein
LTPDINFKEKKDEEDISDFDIIAGDGRVAGFGITGLSVQS